MPHWGLYHKPQPAGIAKPPQSPTVLIKHTRLNLDALNSPSLAAIRRHQISRSASRSFGLRVIRISNIHDDLGVDVFVSSVASASCGLAFGRRAPALSDTGVWKRSVSFVWGSCDTRIILPVEILETTLPSRETVWSYCLVESSYLSVAASDFLRPPLKLEDNETYNSS